MLKIWFLERHDGEILGCTEEEAYELLNRRDSRFRFTIIGVAPAVYLEGNRNIAGVKYAEMMKNATSATQEVKSQLASLKTDRDRYLASAEKFVYEDLLDKDDPKVKKVNEIVDSLNVKIEALEVQAMSEYGNRHKNALEAQIEACRGVVEQPSAASNIITPGVTGDARLKVINQIAL